MKHYPVVLELSANYCREIGRIAITYAYIEHVLQQSAYTMLNVSPQKGRVAMRQPRLNESFEMISELALLEGITLGAEFSGLKKGLETAQTERDKILHGIWVRGDHPTQPILRVTSGSWQPDKTQKGKIKRRIKPEGVALSVGDLIDLHEMLVSLRDAVLQFATQLDGDISALREKT